jgi:hypothetical protein
MANGWPSRKARGELKYAAPDKGLFRVKETKQWSPEARRYEIRRPATPVSTGCATATSIYEFRHSERQLRETKLPPEMRGKAISDGPLPFVFGAKADTLKKRYWMRIVTPPDIHRSDLARGTSSSISSTRRTSPRSS